MQRDRRVGSCGLFVRTFRVRNVPEGYFCNINTNIPEICKSLRNVGLEHTLRLFRFPDFFGNVGTEQKCFWFATSVKSAGCEPFQTVMRSPCRRRRSRRHWPGPLPLLLRPPPGAAAAVAATATAATAAAVFAAAAASARCQLATATAAAAVAAAATAATTCCCRRRRRCCYRRCARCRRQRRRCT